MTPIYNSITLLEAKRTHTFSLLLNESLVKLEDDSDRQQNTGACTNSTHEVSNYGKGSNAHTAEGSSSRDVSVEDVNKGRVTVTFHHHLVVPQLFGNITSGSSRDLNPGLTKQSARGQDEGEVKHSMERIVDDFSKGRRRRNVVRNSSNRDLLSWASISLLPLSEKTDQDIGWSTVVQKLRDKVQVGNQE